MMKAYLRTCAVFTRVRDHLWAVIKYVCAVDDAPYDGNIDDGFSRLTNTSD